MKTEEHDIEREDEGKPPLVSSWRNLYVLVLMNLVVLIALFYAFMKAFE
jgi:hypothetical protein